MRNCLISFQSLKFPLNDEIGFERALTNMLGCYQSLYSEALHHDTYLMIWWSNYINTSFQYAAIYYSVLKETLQCIKLRMLWVDQDEYSHILSIDSNKFIHKGDIDQWNLWLYQTCCNTHQQYLATIRLMFRHPILGHRQSYNRYWSHRDPYY